MAIDKKKINKITSFLESCWDSEENKEDGLTFDERVQLKMQELPADEKKIIEDALSWG